MTYTESSTNTETIYTIEPDSQIANAAVIDVTESVEYGYTSVEQEYLDSWQSIFVSGRADVINSTSVPNTVNTVVVTGSRVTNTSEYEALQVKPEFVGVIYPFCTGATYRAGHRLHGKKTGSNYLGIITTSASMPEDWTEAQSRLDRDWNPYSERVLDYVAEWADQRCTCVADWRTEPEPVPPTCERVWLQASEEKKSSKMERSWGERLVARYGWLVDARLWAENDDHAKCCSRTKTYRLIWDAAHTTLAYGEPRNRRARGVRLQSTTGHRSRAKRERARCGIHSNSKSRKDST